MKLQELEKDHSLQLEDVVKKLRLTNSSLQQEIKEKIDARQKLHKALIAERELGQLKTRFLTLASHEFRTPLSGILTSTSLIDKYIPKTNENISKHLNVIKSMVNHLGIILDDFLALDRIESKETQFKFTEFDFNELIEGIYLECKPLLRKNQTINYTACKGCSRLFQDKMIIRVILINILFNAIKYSPEGAEIDIDVRSIGDEVMISVKDYGIGIPKKEQKNIFSKFFRASNAMHLQGTGIGLNIVQSNVIALGGSIEFESEEGKSTVFTIKLPKNFAS